MFVSSNFFLHSLLGILLVEGVCSLYNLIGDWKVYVGTRLIPDFGKIGCPYVSNHKLGYNMCFQSNMLLCVITKLLEEHVAFLKKSGCNSFTVKFLEPVARTVFTQG